MTQVDCSKLSEGFDWDGLAWVNRLGWIYMYPLQQTAGLCFLCLFLRTSTPTPVLKAVEAVERVFTARGVYFEGKRRGGSSLQQPWRVHESDGKHPTRRKEAALEIMTKCFCFFLASDENIMHLAALYSDSKCNPPNINLVGI